MFADYLPLAFMAVVVVAFATGSIVVSLFFSPRRPNASKVSPFECGMPSDGIRDMRVPIKYYIVALLFLVFDVETVFILIWAIVFREFVDAGLGLFILVEMAVFLGILIAGLGYAWKKGALEWK